VRVPIGNYQVKAEASGFHSSVQLDLTLVLNQTARPRLRLFIPYCQRVYQQIIGSPQIRFEQRDRKEHNLSWLTMELNLAWRTGLVQIAQSGYGPPHLAERH
jgi:hypothetical protein